MEDLFFCDTRYRLDTTSEDDFDFNKNQTKTRSNNNAKNWREPEIVQNIDGSWEVVFKAAFGGPVETVVNWY